MIPSHPTSKSTILRSSSSAPSSKPSPSLWSGPSFSSSSSSISHRIRANSFIPALIRAAPSLYGYQPPLSPQIPRLHNPSPSLMVPSPHWPSLRVPTPSPSEDVAPVHRMDPSSLLPHSGLLFRPDSRMVTSEGFCALEEYREPSHWIPPPSSHFHTHPHPHSPPHHSSRGPVPSMSLISSLGLQESLYLSTSLSSSPSISPGLPKQSPPLFSTDHSPLPPSSPRSLISYSPCSSSESFASALSPSPSPSLRASSLSHKGCPTPRLSSSETSTLSSYPQDLEMIRPHPSISSSSSSSSSSFPLLSTYSPSPILMPFSLSEGTHSLQVISGEPIHPEDQGPAHSGGQEEFRPPSRPITVLSSSHSMKSPTFHTSPTQSMVMSMAEEGQEDAVDEGKEIDSTLGFDVLSITPKPLDPEKTPRPWNFPSTSFPPLWKEEEGEQQPVERTIMVQRITRSPSSPSVPLSACPSNSSTLSSSDSSFSSSYSSSLSSPTDPYPFYEAIPSISWDGLPSKFPMSPPFPPFSSPSTPITTPGDMARIWGDVSPKPKRKIPRQVVQWLDQVAQEWTG
ncbi:MAG: hypothetical protein DHS80DRAFT_28824 [Piptocephalis tieghemiana]|nr:MAG: hypothetical protein DHS80DRAFT_28824 [Piptocephalis tieghemiana]